MFSSFLAEVLTTAHLISTQPLLLKAFPPKEPQQTTFESTACFFSEYNQTHAHAPANLVQNKGTTPACFQSHFKRHKLHILNKAFQLPPSTESVPQFSLRPLALVQLLSSVREMPFGERLMHNPSPSLIQQGGGVPHLVCTE